MTENQNTQTTETQGAEATPEFISIADATSLETPTQGADGTATETQSDTGTGTQTQTQTLEQATTSESGQTSQQQTETTQQTQTQTDTTSSDVFGYFLNQVKEKQPDYQLPDEIAQGTPAQKLSFLAEVFSKLPEQNDPFIRDYMTAKKSGKTSTDFIKERQTEVNVLELPSKDYMIQHLTGKNGKTEENPNGWSPEMIRDHVEAMNPIDLDLKADELKGTQRAEITTKQETTQTKAREEYMARVDRVNNETIEQAGTLFGIMKAETNIGGIPHTDSDQSDFKDVFLSATQINPETGESRLRDLFSDDKALYKALYLLHKSNNGDIDKWMSTFRQDYKEKLKDKLRVNQSSSVGQTAFTAVPKPEDFV